ncbi:hypothetical protein E4U53_002090 [Claviceps sorghi]|nr:hypothetical protein E4U53_002090 [Claviceps sorghi]
MNGGPGCSSFLGFLQENGPIQWRPGTAKPVPNPWGWSRLTNVVWVEQPVGVGFSTGTPNIRNEKELAAQFAGWWKNFVDTFSMQGYKIYVVGESYGGYYAPYISSHFVDANDTKYFDVHGLMVVDGVSFNGDVQAEVVAETFLDQNYRLIPLDDPFMDTVHNISKTCGYRDYMKKYYTYPPSGPQPDLLPWTEKLANGTVVYKPGCGDLWGRIFQEAWASNPCFDVYNIQNYCPFVTNSLVDAPPFFDREDVKKAIHAPTHVQWGECASGVFVKGDDSEPPFLHELPNVIDKTQNVIYAQGGMDYLLNPIGVFLGVQNMTWGGKMGFQSQPKSPFYVPRWGWRQRNDAFYGNWLPDKSGVVGTTHTERGLTVAVVNLAGHEGPQYASTAALRQLEKLLGRVKSLSDKTPFTLPEISRNEVQDLEIGQGTYPVPYLVHD